MRSVKRTSSRSHKPIVSNCSLLASNPSLYFSSRKVYNITTPYLSLVLFRYYFPWGPITIFLAYDPLTCIILESIPPNITLSSSQSVPPPKPWNFQREVLVKLRFFELSRNMNSKKGSCNMETNAIWKQVMSTSKTWCFSFLLRAETVV